MLGQGGIRLSGTPMSTEQRNKPRHRCVFNVEARANKWQRQARVIDISKNGMCIDTGETMDIWTGESIEIRCEELGYLTGKARWRRFGRIGIEFRDTTDIKAKLDAFQRFFFKDVTT